MNDFTAFKNQIFIYTLIVAVFCQLISLIFLGVDVKFSYGLVLGTCVAIVNFNLLVFSSKAILKNSKGKGFAFASYIIRLLIYGVAFYMAMKVSVPAGLASVVGFLTLKLAIFYVCGIKTKFSKGRTVTPEVQQEFEQMDKQKAAHTTDRLRDKIRREIDGFDEDEDEQQDTETERQNIEAEHQSIENEWQKIESARQAIEKERKDIEKELQDIEKKRKDIEKSGATIEAIEEEEG